MSCGCTHTPCEPCCSSYGSSVSYVLPDCPGGEPCDEISEAPCVLYKGPNLPALGISNNDRLITILTKLHKVLNGVITPTIPLTTYTATNTTTLPSIPTFNISYLGLGPVYTSTAGATSSSTTITVGSTTNLVIGMVVEVTAGVGAFATNTLVVTIPSATTFTVSQVPSTPLSGGATVVTGTGSTHTIFSLKVVKNIPQSFKAFTGSVVTDSGTGTVV
jgi:hypothetical protein